MPDRTSVPEQTTQAHCVTCSQGWSVLGCNVRDNFGDGGASLDLRLLHLQRKRDVFARQNVKELCTSAIARC